MMMMLATIELVFDSGKEAEHVQRAIDPDNTPIPDGIEILTSVIEGTLLVLAVFATLAIIGITESAVVALSIFIFHMGAQAIFIILGFFNLPDGFRIFGENLRTLPAGQELLIAIFFGFSW